MTLTRFDLCHALGAAGVCYQASLYDFGYAAPDGPMPHQVWLHTTSLTLAHRFLEAVDRRIVARPFGQTQSRHIGDDDDADIVLCAARDRALDQPVGGCFHGMIAQYRCNLGIGERAAEPIRA